MGSEMCIRDRFEANGVPELIKKLKNLKVGKIPTSYSYGLEDVINRLLEKDPSKRISAEELVGICQKFGKKREEHASFESCKEILMDTIQFPEGDQKWVNLVPLPPKFPTVKDTNRSR